MIIDQLAHVYATIPSLAIFPFLPVSALPGLLYSKPIPCFGTLDGPVLVLLTTRARC
jgi:hypothetical protein